jgi:hypothetical protein
MSYVNEYLRDFRPVFLGILKAKGIRPEQLVLEILDEESPRYSLFEPADVLDVLAQLADDINRLTIYTERAVYFAEFAEKMYEENGLLVTISSRNKFEGRRIAASEKEDTDYLVLDFEWEGKCHMACQRYGRYYMPIHKKRWLAVDNLDIMVPFGYNTLIVKGLQREKREPIADRFEAAFYNGYSHG